MLLILFFVLFVGQSSGSDGRRDRAKPEIKNLYLKLSCVLEDSSYLSKKPFCTTHYSVHTPMAGDLLSLLDPLTVGQAYLCFQNMRHNNIFFPFRNSSMKAFKISLY